MKCLTRRAFLKRAIGYGVPALLATYAVGVERYILDINTYRIAVPNLPSVFNGFRMVQLSDLHYGALMPLACIRRVIRLANEIPRDAVICTGDYVLERNAAHQIDTVWPVIAELNAPLGVYAVLGNHDHWADTTRSQHWLTASGFDLRRRATRIEKDGKGIWLAGAGDHWTDPVDIDTLLAEVPDADCRIVLAHNPDTADTPHAARCDLIVSGHTHGGQVNIPFFGPPILPVRNKNYSHGLRLSAREEKVFISKGIGWAIYPIRFNCVPEIAVLELVASG